MVLVSLHQNTMNIIASFVLSIINQLHYIYFKTADIREYQGFPSAE
jgi:hypothetical protein